MKILPAVLAIANILFFTSCKDDDATILLRSGKLIGTIVTHDEFGINNNDNYNISVEAINKQDSSIYKTTTDNTGKFIFNKVKFGTYKFVIKGDNYPLKIINNVELLMDERIEYYLSFDLYSKPTTIIHLDSTDKLGNIFGKLKYNTENEGRTQYIFYNFSWNPNNPLNIESQESDISQITLDSTFYILFPYTIPRNDTIYITAYISPLYPLDTNFIGKPSNTIRYIRPSSD